MKAIRRLIARLFRYETMSGNGACPVYLERWTLLQLFGWAAYLHHFLGDDWALDPHDHPRRFISIGLLGWYIEDVFEPGTGALAGEAAPEMLVFHARQVLAEHDIPEPYACGVARNACQLDHLPTLEDLGPAQLAQVIKILHTQAPRISAAAKRSGQTEEAPF